VLGDLVGVNLRSWWTVLRHWVGWSFLFRARGDNALPRAERIQFAVFWLAVAGVVFWLGALPYLVVLWLLPMWTLLLACMRVRIVAEHDVARRGDELETTRHVEGTRLERFAVAPLNINHHIAHHLWPTIPLSNLPKMHAILMADPEFRARAMVLPRYFGRRDGLLAGLLL
jgi:fatty acid desaturase